MVRQRTANPLSPSSNLGAASNSLLKMKVVISINTQKEVMQSAISEIIRAVSGDVFRADRNGLPLKSAASGDN